MQYCKFLFCSRIKSKVSSTALVQKKENSKGRKEGGREGGRDSEREEGLGQEGRKEGRNKGNTFSCINNHSTLTERPVAHGFQIK